MKPLQWYQDLSTLFCQPYVSSLFKFYTSTFLLFPSRQNPFSPFTYPSATIPATIFVANSGKVTSETGNALMTSKCDRSGRSKNHMWLPQNLVEVRHMNASWRARKKEVQPATQKAIKIHQSFQSMPFPGSCVGNKAERDQADRL